MSSLQDFLPLLLSALNVTAPIFILILFGVLLSYKKIINEKFIEVTSKIIFNVGLPLILFTSTASRNFEQLINIRYILLLFVTTILMFIISNFIAQKAINIDKERGIFVQGAFRGNLIIIGLALASNAYGEFGVAIATLPTAMMIIVYNVMSIYTLDVSLNQHSFSLKNTGLNILKNPLIIGIVAGLLVNYINISLPLIWIKTNDYVSKVTLTLALISIGGALNVSQLKDNIRVATLSSFLKVVLSPLILILLLRVWPVEPKVAGVLFLLAAAPTATASFIMVKAMGGNSDLASKIIVISTFLSLFTITFGFALLIFTGLIQ